ncbi:protein of unknown function [Pseudomonas inefficax]|uniref:Uncharacterized protein n=1 Tax=Pseudomonas inefficax TaxID=2078786 RepID=A0AAQ1PCD7_9PSED|nr:protein of unknown function [Pseudomonas inefficax]
MRERGDDWSRALFYYGDDALNQYRYERLDLRLAKRFRVHGSNLYLAALWQQRLDDEPTTTIQNRYNSRHRLSVSAELEF